MPQQARSQSQTSRLQPREPIKDSKLEFSSYYSVQYNGKSIREFMHGQAYASNMRPELCLLRKRYKCGANKYVTCAVRLVFVIGLCHERDQICLCLAWRFGGSSFAASSGGRHHPTAAPQVNTLISHIAVSCGVEPAGYICCQDLSWTDGAFYIPASSHCTFGKRLVKV